MASYNTPKLRGLLSTEARTAVVRDQKNSTHYIGMTRCHVEQGLLFCEINWGIDGTDMPISPDVESYIESFDIREIINPLRAPGVYSLKRGQEVLAKGLIVEYDAGGGVVKSDIRVTGAKRKDAVKLFGDIVAGRVRPDVEHAEFEQVEGNLNELRRLRRENTALKSRLEVSDGKVRTLDEQLNKAHRDLTEAVASSRLPRA